MRADWLVYVGIGVFVLICGWFCVAAIRSEHQAIAGCKDPKLVERHEEMLMTYCGEGCWAPTWHSTYLYQCSDGHTIKVSGPIKGAK